MHDAPPPARAGALPAMPPIWLLAMLSALGPLSTDLYLPALPAIGADFGAGPAAVQWTLSGFLMGFAPAMLFVGPLADRFGRRPLALAGTALFVLASLACALAPTLPLLVGARVVQAVGASTGPVLSRAIVRDTCPPVRIGAVFATISGVMSLAPAVGPVLGGVLIGVGGWELCFVALALMSLVLGATLWRLLPETAPALDPRATDAGALLTAAREFAASRHYRLHTAVATASYSALFAFISGGTYVVQQGLGLSAFQFGLCFGVVAAAYFLGAMVSRAISPRLGTRRMILYGAIWSLAIGALGFAGLLLAGPSLATVVLPMVLIMLGFAQTQPNAMAGAVTPFPHMAGRASSALGFVQWGIAALSGLVLAAVLDVQGFALGAFMLGWLVLALLAALALPRTPATHPAGG
jgi:DHA1 family bicyclomycin/chloramphenicol resistance-like MFS transporter